MTPPCAARLEVPDDAARGRGDYSAYHALWHLAEIGVVADLKNFTSDGWNAAAARIDAGQPPTRVALIDTSVAAAHPNLAGAVSTNLAIDFFSDRLGCPATPQALAAVLDERQTALPTTLPTTLRDLWTELQTHLLGSGGARTGSPVQPATSPSFSAHGTAMAGLIGARPVAAGAVPVVPIRVFDPASGTTQDLPGGSAMAFAYAGVDPYCDIVPISTNFDPEPEQLILALLYAAMIGAEVIVLARDFPTPASLAPGVSDTAAALGRALGVDLSSEELDGWRRLQDLTLAISRHIPIVCAAGNGALTSVLFPGSLAAPDNGIISVGARTASGQVAAYSPVSDDISIYAPSGDGERLDLDMQRLDTQGAGFNPHDHSAQYATRLGSFGDPSQTGKPGKSIHAPQDLVSTDVPGRAGYNSSPNAQVFGRDGAVLDYRSAYCRFSGTSGAVALTAGMLSLAISAGRLRPGSDDFGLTAKAALCGTGERSYARAEPTLDWTRFAPPVPEPGS